MKQHIQMGNTVRLTAQFYDWGGNPVDPALVKIKFYDGRFKQLEEQSVGAGNKLDVGSYYFDYVPQIPDTIYYEWYAEIDGLPSLKRASITVRKI